MPASTSNVVIRLPGNPHGYLVQTGAAAGSIQACGSASWSGRNGVHQILSRENGCRALKDWREPGTGRFGRGQHIAAYCENRAGVRWL